MAASHELVPDPATVDGGDPASNVLEHGPLPHGASADALGITSGSVTALVDRLVEAGYVERQVSPTDRRRVEVVLTPTTYQAFATVHRPCGAAVEASLDELTGRQQHAAATALELAVAAILDASLQLRPDA
ncbi:MAG: MarR family transcriptional regulator [Actinomycetota bacterium]